MASRCLLWNIFCRILYESKQRDSATQVRISSSDCRARKVSRDRYRRVSHNIGRGYTMRWARIGKQNVMAEDIQQKRYNWSSKICFVVAWLIKAAVLQFVCRLCERDSYRFVNQKVVLSMDKAPIHKWTSVVHVVQEITLLVVYCSSIRKA